VSRIADELLTRRPELLDIDGAYGVSERAVRRVTALAAPLAAYFRFRAGGFERVPEGPCLIVANHSVGALFEVPLLLRAWRLGMGARPVRGLIHRIAYEPPLSWVRTWEIGGVLAHPPVARRVLDRGQPLLVFPGGDLDACRPFRDRYRVVFGGRTGFVRLAREAGVPIVPAVIGGAHAAYVVLPGGSSLARLLGAERHLGLKALPLTAGMPLALAAAVATAVHPPAWPALAAALANTLVPAPARIELEILEPLRVREDESDAEAAERVRATMETALGRIAARRLTPWE